MDHFPYSVIYLVADEEVVILSCFHQRRDPPSGCGGCRIPLSQCAVTAREVRVPAVMAVHGALTALRDGERVRVNGSQGVVSRVD
jgi:rifampicin phosphotransferase